MKKLKRFSVKSMTVLSNQEMALINGGIVIDALDHCGVDDQGKNVFIKYITLMAMMHTLSAPAM